MFDFTWQFDVKTVKTKKMLMKRRQSLTGETFKSLKALEKQAD